MRQSAKTALALMAGLAIGIGAMAQGTKKPAYVIAHVEVSDQAAFQAYAAKVPETLKPFNGHIIARGKPISKEGAPPPDGIVALLSFDSLADAEKWWTSPAYAPLIAERQKAAKSSIYFVEGLPQ